MQKEARFREYGFMDLTFLKITSAGLRNVCMCVCFVTQSCPTLVTPWTIAHQAPLSMEIILARILEWVAMPSFRRCSQPRHCTQVSHIAGRFFTFWTPGIPKNMEWVAYPFSRGPAWPRNWTVVSWIAGGSLPAELPGRPIYMYKNNGEVN